MNVMIVDDDPLIIQSIKLILSKESDMVLFSAANGAEAIQQCTAMDVILMDIRMPVIDGVEATQRIKALNPSVSIMMLTTFDDRESIEQALAAGADGYLIKNEQIADIANKLRLLKSGSAIVDKDVLGKLTRNENPRIQSLTQRERSIARLVAKGLPNKEIAKQLFISEGTVRNNIVTIMEKLAVRNRTELSRVYYEKD